MKKSPVVKEVKLKRTLASADKQIKPDYGDKLTVDEEALRREREAVMHDQFRTYKKSE